MSEQADGLRAPASPSARAGASDLLVLLEERIARLIERHRDARRTIAELRSQLKERDRRVGELNERVYALGRVRADARKRVDRLIAELERLERRGGAGRSRSQRA
jgi:chromosome segregation ATPase